MTRHLSRPFALTLALSAGALGVAPARIVSAADASPPDACKVLSAKDAQSLLKNPIVKTTTPAAGTGCRFETANGSYVEVHTGYEFAYVVGSTGGPQATLPLAGVGDKAKMAKAGNGVVAVKGQISCGASEGGIDWPRETLPARQMVQAQKLGALCSKYFAAAQEK